jgi:hypothetical protein
MLMNSKMSNQIFCSIRQEWVAALPEEMVRQSLIHQMTHQWGYPISGFALEKDLKQMPHLCVSALKLPKRRADLVFFAKGIHNHYSLYPLLLIECKAVKLTPKSIRQVVGYNFYLKAPFIAIVNQNETRLGWYDFNQEGFTFISHIPSYSDLLAKRNQLSK